MLPHMTSRLSSVWVLVLLASAIAIAEPPNGGDRGHPTIENISGRGCKGGAHAQPDGPFGVYVFCDDAVGTNIAVFYQELGEPRYGKWTLTRRFWQDGPWAADVSALGWVPSRNLLVVATSEIYGSGAVYLLNLESQTFAPLGSTNDCGSAILAVTDSSVTLGLNNCEDSKPFKKITLRFPQTDPAARQ
jgi:hypothetical protein